MCVHVCYKVSLHVKNTRVWYTVPVPSVVHSAHVYYTCAYTCVHVYCNTPMDTFIAILVLLDGQNIGARPYCSQMQRWPYCHTMTSWNVGCYDTEITPGDVLEDMDWYAQFDCSLFFIVVKHPVVHLAHHEGIWGSNFPKIVS